MNIAPLLEAPLAVQIHVAAVLPAALLGPVLFAMRKGTALHRLLGRIWIGLMAVTALSSFFIHTIDLFHGFSPIHLLSIYVLHAGWRAVQAARQRRIAAHRFNVIGMYVGGILVAGGFTLLPGRLMNTVMFSAPSHWPDGARLALVLSLLIGMAAAFALLTAIWAKSSMPRRGTRDEASTFESAG